MGDNWKKVQAKKVDAKLEDTLARKLNHLKSVISDPDKYNSNLASKDRVESLEQQIEELQEVIKKLSRRVDGLSYLIKQKINI
jgi:vacuolar-type H+-ATPase subunit D/Vma8